MNFKYTCILKKTSTNDKILLHIVRCTINTHKSNLINNYISTNTVVLIIINATFICVKKKIFVPSRI